MPTLTFTDRLACLALGAMFGALYGLVLGFFALEAPGAGSSEIISFVKVTAVVFGVLGFLVGPFVGDLIAAALHFLLALFALDVGYFDRRLGIIWSLFWLGLGTVAAILIVKTLW